MTDELMSPKYSQAELDRKLLDAANCLRGPVDPADFKAYIFPLLFFKRISDAWHYEHDKALENFDGDEKLAAHPDNYRFVVPDGCLWEDLQAVSENVGAALQLILERIEEANPETLGGIFGGVRWGDKERLPESALTGVIDVFDTLDLNPEEVPYDLLGNAYEYLLKNFADESGKKAGEFFTPRTVVRLMAQILEPAEDESICDPACGSGGLLIESINEVREAGGDARTLQIYGQEINQTTAAIAKMNLFLHDIETFKIARGDTLRDPKLKDPEGGLMQFDMIVANPPFSLDNWGRESWATDPYGRADLGVPPKKYADLAFVQHMLKTMSPETGRMAVVMPDGVLFRKGEEKKIREGIIEGSLLEAIIALPKNLFYNTDIHAYVLVFRSEIAQERNGRVLFIDGSERFRKGTNQNEMTSEDVDVLVQAYRTGLDPDGEGGVYVRSVPKDEIVEKDYDLNIGRYLKRRTEEGVEIEEALSAYTEARRELRAAEEVLSERLREAGFSA